MDENGDTYEDKDLVRYWYLKPESISWVQKQNGNRQIEKVPDWSVAEQIENGSLVIIDEVQNYYSNRDFATEYSKACIDYITKNRHFGWTLWWMSQSVESVDVTFRRNTQYVYFLERKEIFGSDTTSSVKMFEGWLAGNKTAIPPFATSTFRFDKRYFNAYKSYVSGVQEEKRYKTNVWLNHKGFMICVVLFLLVILGLIIINPFKTMDRVTHKKDPVTHTPTPTPTPTSFSVGAGAGVEETSVNDTLCVTNYFVNNNVSYVVLNNGKTRRVKAGDNYAECE